MQKDMKAILHPGIALSRVEAKDPKAYLMVSLK